MDIAAANTADWEKDTFWCQGRAEDIRYVTKAYPSRKGKCLLCGRVAKVDNSGRTFRHRPAIAPLEIRQ